VVGDVCYFGKEKQEEAKELNNACHSSLLLLLLLLLLTFLFCCVEKHVKGREGPEWKAIVGFTDTTAVDAVSFPSPSAGARNAVHILLFLFSVLVSHDWVIAVFLRFYL
jgi:hypothetical protein